MADDGRDAGIRVERRDEPDRVEERPGYVAPEMDVRDEDLEPHAGLRYIARLFKVLAILLILLLIAEIVLGLVQQGRAGHPAAADRGHAADRVRGAAVGRGDMGLMLIESNHDLRATRILVGRLNSRVQRLEQVATTGSPRGGTGPQLPPPVPRRAPRASALTG